MATKQRQQVAYLTLQQGCNSENSSDEKTAAA
jgi:hypothetical protein